MEWVESNDKEKMSNAAYILREFYEDEAYYHIVRELIIKSGGDPKILGELSSSIYTSAGGTSRALGQPSPKLIQRIDYLTKLKDTCDNVKVKRFADKQIEYANKQIQAELERDEDLED